MRDSSLKGVPQGIVSRKSKVRLWSEKGVLDLTTFMLQCQFPKVLAIECYEVPGPPLPLIDLLLPLDQVFTSPS